MRLALVFLFACSPTPANNGNSTSGLGASTGSLTGPGGGNGFTAASHPAIPTVVNVGGQPYANPVVIPIFYEGDSNQSTLTDFFSELAASDYWSNAVSEYHVGDLTIATPLTMTGTAGAQIPDSTLQTALANNIGHAWGPQVTGGIYLFILPSGSRVTETDDTECCDAFDGYHDEAPVGASSVAYGVVCDCPGFDGPGIDEPAQMTVALSHEIAEASTDPLVESDPAYYQTDPAHGDCTAMTGGEVADMCEFNPGAYVIPDDMKYTVQQIYSDDAARAGTDPCLPVVLNADGSTPPYFNSIGVFNDTTTLTGYGSSESVNIGVGASATIEVDLFSTASTAAWTVEAYDYNQYIEGGAAELSFSWDKTTGQNGDVLHLTIKVLSHDDTFDGELFIIESTLGEQTNLSYGCVGEP